LLQRVRFLEMPFVIPEPREVIELIMGDGALIRVRVHGNSQGPRILISNGNGFAVDGYYPFWGPLCDRFEVIAFDFRNHGQNPLCASGLAGHTYAQMALDLNRVFREVAARLGKKTTIGVFHSMSGRTAMKHACELGFIWDALILFDPPNVPPQGHREYPRMEAFEHRLIEWAATRPNEFRNPQELAQQYKGNRGHSTWVEGAHDLMADSVLRKLEDNDLWVLACPREFEASIYSQAKTLNLWPTKEQIGGPFKLIACDPEAKGAPGPAFANRALAEDMAYEYDCILGTGHLLQIQKPEECRRSMFKFLDQIGLRY
jgi:pimeloyl-ACP methyl ester carboxylesterase